jgi:hypothetical protein
MGKDDAVDITPGKERTVDKFAAVIAVDTNKREREDGGASMTHFWALLTRGEALLRLKSTPSGRQHQRR